MLFKHTPLQLAILTTLILVSCTTIPITNTPTGAIPNPASVHCEEKGGVLELRTSESGTVDGVCIFPDGSECDEWQYFRGTCLPGDSFGPPEETAEEASPGTGDGWNIWHDDQTGFTFQYPSDATLVPNDDPLAGLSVVGPLVGDDQWPMFYISHPVDRDEYRPPEGADLAQWLTDNNMIGAERLPDAQIAGTRAIHSRQEASPQTYASDIYFFAKSGQLYNVVILHTGDREDWPLYSRFLDSIQFDQ
jgi:putative hemolysin